MRTVDKMMRAMVTGSRWKMATASYAYSRAHGLSVRDALIGAVELYFSWTSKP